MWDLIVSVPDHCLSFYFGAPVPGVWQFGLGPPRRRSSGRIRKRAKARGQIRDRKLQI